MSQHAVGFTRRQAMLLLGASSTATAFPFTFGAGRASAATTTAAPGADPVSDTYHRVLLSHTRWSEQQWDPAQGHYTDKDFGFAVVLGNAVLLTRGAYDAERAGVDQDTLRARTLATVKHFAASNRLAGGTQWGRKLFWDTTFQSYFVLAARLLWDDLDEATRRNVDTIAREQAQFTAQLGTGDDPDSGGWTPHGLSGGFEGDTKLEEMGVYTQSLAPGLAWASDDPRYEAWRAAFGRWSRNEAGLPAADLANPARVDGVAVSANTAQNLYDTFIVENHGSFGPHYQEELWRTSGRNSAHFLAAGRDLPEVLTAQPNAGPLWRTLLGVMSDAGEPLMPMVADREHLYGRDIIPLAFLAQVVGDRAAARCELALAERLEAYQEYPPQYRLAKFSGESKYEPEARAELAISYLLHEWRARSGQAPVRPLSQRELFEQASGVTDHGPGPGLVSHQSPGAWSGVVSKPGFVKFAWQPAHDDWLFALSGTTPMFLPSTGAEVTGRSVVTYSLPRDGFDGSASLLTLDSGFAGFTTLPSGAVVYATSGTAYGEGHLEVHNLAMPGMPGLGGSRTYRVAEGSTTVVAGSGATTSAGPRVDELTFARGQFRHLRMLGARPDPSYGYSLYAFEIRDGASGPDLAREAGATASASSFDPGKEPALAVDGVPTSRWAVSRADRPRADSWIAVDLGASRDVDRVTLRWEAAAGRAYRIQGSTDGQGWTDLGAWPRPDLTSRGGWLDIDGRAGLLVRGGANPLSVYGDTVVLSDGPAQSVLVEALPGATTEELRTAAAREAPSARSAQVRAAVTDHHLSLFNLSSEPVTTTVTIPGSRAEGIRLYQGVQTVTDSGTAFRAELPAAAAALAPVRIVLSGARIPTGLRAEVLDGRTVRLTGPSCRLTVSAQGRSLDVTVRTGRTTTVTVPRATEYPLADLALGRTTFPTAPLPPGMTDPGAAVDGDPGTAWKPGPDGRMVVDLGSEQHITEIRTQWRGGHTPASQVEFSLDGRTYSGAAHLSARGVLRTDRTARYVALRVLGSATGPASLVALNIA
ncbi:discoidin domain-containing protein [Streptomyces sp. NBC_00243]|uniref:discoidin domain-containing protein n=1 Tax=Streptomyces sp. NBC_00243 TaxID=2975688 RepID=UPI002DDB263E|nr:discoidin domain-containing protein [Streptomyces sp. NBC_00243]WRZ18698.1 discoidin domain-containing protein [Streptomyces sp. NBC_00243]